MGTTESWDSKYATLGSLYELKAKKRKKSSKLLKNALTFWSYESLSSFTSTPNLSFKKRRDTAASSVHGRNGRRSHSISACVSEVTKCALQILYSGSDCAEEPSAGSACFSAAKNGLPAACSRVRNNRNDDQPKLSGVTCLQKRRLQKLRMLQIHEEETDMVEENSEDYDANNSDEIPPSPPPPLPPPMPPDGGGRFSETAISISKKKRRGLSPLPEQDEECDSRVFDEMLLKTAGVLRFQSRFNSWPETAPVAPVSKNCCRQCYGVALSRRLSAPVPICVTYYRRVRLRSFSHLLAGVATPRRSHGDACADVSTSVIL
jgi:hypothetical protein